ncbi:MAG: hypothetical protein LBF83_11090 [Spirochaetaceae bacterium]|nr:hypothetical protein [Spirochaetaceae bacterium]
MQFFSKFIKQAGQPAPNIRSAVTSRKLISASASTTIRAFGIRGRQARPAPNIRSAVTSRKLISAFAVTIRRPPHIRRPPLESFFNVAYTKRTMKDTATITIGRRPQAIMGPVSALSST